MSLPRKVNLFFLRLFVTTQTMGWRSESGQTVAEYAVVLLVAAAIIPVAVILLNAPTAPPPMASMAAASRQTSQDFPAPRHFLETRGPRIRPCRHGWPQPDPATAAAGSRDR